jgi:mono/diheme cytochrome c family protein
MDLTRPPMWRVIARWLLILGVPLACLALLTWTIGIRVVPPTVVRDAGNGIGVITATQDTALGTGRHLYANYCAACHGEKGDGNGPAAKYLNPRPA